MERLSNSHSRKASLSISDFFTPQESVTTKSRNSTTNFRDSVLELQHSQQSHLALESKRRTSISTQYASSHEHISFFDKLVHRSLLTQIAWVFRQVVPKSKNIKNGIEYLDCFTGTVAVVSNFF